MFSEKLNQYLIPGGLAFINKWCKGYAVQLKIKNARNTKLGDYRKLKDAHQITLNYGMHKELSFLTLTHEIAHMHVHEKFGNHVKPHGKVWKHTFSNLILESLNLYSAELQPILIEFAKNPRAGFYAYQPLTAYFHSNNNSIVTVLKDLPADTIFRMKNKIFKKGKKRKIRYLCTEVATGKKYSVHPLAPIDEIIEA